MAAIPRISTVPPDTLDRAGRIDCLLPSPAIVSRHASAIGTWELAASAPPPVLAGIVREYVGWFEHMAIPLVRRELPTDEAPLIIAFGAPFRLFDLADPSRYRDVGSFVTGAYDTAQLVGSTGPSGGVQINFTLLGMRLLVGRPLADLTNRAEAVDDILGPSARTLADQLCEAPTWDARFALVTRVILDRLPASREVPAGVLSAWRSIVSSRGRTPIRAIVDDTGWSQKHLIDRVRHELGLAPKTLARVVRFGRAVRAIRAGRVQRLADLSLACGYYDQAHLTRDVRALSGVTPSELIASLLPDRGGFATDADEARAG